MEGRKERVIFIEVLRVISMLAVIIIHIVASDANINELTFINDTFYNLLHTLMNFCVPIFVMISGYLLLNRNKSITIKQIFCKYILRMILILLTFGILYSLLEQIFETRNINIKQIGTAILDVITGNLWDHMWYIYMLIFLYLITPILKIFVNNAKNNDIFYTIMLLFVVSSCLTLLERIFDIKFAISMSEFSAYIIYYLIGYYVSIISTEKYKKYISYIFAFMSLILIILSIVYSFTKIEMFTHLWGYTSPLIIIWSTCMFIIFKDKKWNISERLKRIIFSISNNSFGIYIIHPLFINIVYKVLKLTPSKFGGVITVPIFLLLFTVLSYIATFILKKVKFVRKYIL